MKNDFLSGLDLKPFLVRGVNDFVLQDWKEKSKDHVDWVKTWIQTLNELQVGILELFPGNIIPDFFLALMYESCGILN